MVRRFQEVFEDYIVFDSQFCICFFSWYYFFIKFWVGFQLSLEKLFGYLKDLEEYVFGNFDVDSFEEKIDIIVRFLEKVKGIFLWMVLVVDYFNEDMFKGLLFEERISMRFEQVLEGFFDLFKYFFLQYFVDMGIFRFKVFWLFFLKRLLSFCQVDYVLWLGVYGDEL